MTNEQNKLKLCAFLKAKGISLAQFGSSEYGLKILDAIELTGLIDNAGLSVFGIEKWIELDGRHKLASLDGWVSNTDADPTCNYDSAMAYLKECLKGPPALYTIQFG